MSAARTGLLAPVRAVVDRRTWLGTIHVLLDMWVGIVSFTVVITLLSTAAGLAVTFLLAIPVAWLLFVSARWIGRMERARAAALLDVRVADPHRERRASVQGSWLRRLSSDLGAAASWKEIAYSLLMLPVGVVGSVLVLSAWGSVAALLVLPAIPGGEAHFWAFTLTGSSLWLGPAAGLVGLLIAPWIARGWALLDAGLVRGLLGPDVVADLEARVDELTTTRALAVDAAEEERRRIERDLHDGAQQRLVALSIDLGMAKAKFESDPAGAKALLDEAHAESKRAIAELRDLARGIHPVALTDRGLPGAIPGLAARAPLPVDVHVDVAERPSPAIEGIAYFLVSEALTNLVKHAGARRGTVDIRRVGDRLRVAIGDDGHGGATLGGGTGLRGLADRVAAVDGTFSIDSPAGGPTWIRAELPCTAEVAR